MLAGWFHICLELRDWNCADYFLFAIKPINKGQQATERKNSWENKVVWETTVEKIRASFFFTTRMTEQCISYGKIKQSTGKKKLQHKYWGTIRYGLYCWCESNGEENWKKRTEKNIYKYAHCYDMFHLLAPPAHFKWTENLQRKII